MTSLPVVRTPSLNQLTTGGGEACERGDNVDFCIFRFSYYTFLEETVRIREILNGLFASYGEAEVKAECRPSSDDHAVLELSLEIKPGWYYVGTKEKKD